MPQPTLDCECGATSRKPFLLVRTFRYGGQSFRLWRTPGLFASRSRHSQFSRAFRRLDRGIRWRFALLAISTVAASFVAPPYVVCAFYSCLDVQDLSRLWKVCWNVNAKKRKLLTIGLISAICAVAALVTDHDFLAMVFMLEGIIAGVFGLL
jgi:hypothetical protein